MQQQFNIAVKINDPNIAKFPLQYSVWLYLIIELLEVERLNKSYDLVKLYEFSEHLCLYFYLVVSLSFSRDKSDPRYVFTYFLLFKPIDIKKDFIFWDFTPCPQTCFRLKKIINSKRYGREKNLLRSNF